MDIPRNRLFHLLADHNGVDAATYDLLIDGAVVQTQPVTALQGGTIVFSNLVVTQVGTHTAMVRTTGPAGSVDSAVLPFVVVPALPEAAVNLRITLV